MPAQVEQQFNAGLDSPATASGGKIGGPVCIRQDPPRGPEQRVSLGDFDTVDWTLPQFPDTGGEFRVV